MTLLIAEVASYHSATLEITELLRVTHSFTSVLQKQSALLDARCYTPVAIEVIGYAQNFLFFFFFFCSFRPAINSSLVLSLSCSFLLFYN